MHGEHVYYRKVNGETQAPGALEKGRSGDSVQGLGDGSCPGRAAKNLDRGSQSDAHPKDTRSEESCPDRATSKADNHDDDDDDDIKGTNEGPCKQETEQEWNKGSSAPGGSPFSRTLTRPNGTTQLDDAKDAKKFDTKDHSSSAGGHFFLGVAG